MALTKGQRQFRDRLARQTGLSPSVVGAWMLAEESGGAAQKREAQGNQNWLNIGYFDSGPGAITKDKSFRDPVSAADATAQFLRGEKFGASPGIRKILSARGKNPQAQVQAIASSGWATNPRYGQSISRLLGQGGTAETTGGTGVVSPASPAPTTTQIPGQTIRTEIPTVDQAGFQQAQRQSMLGQMIAKRNPNSFLLRSGLLSTAAPSLQDFVGSKTVKDVIPGATVRVAKVPTGSTGSAGVASAGGGAGASAALGWAQSKIGFRESGENQGGLASYLNRRFGFNAAPWCAMFTSAAVTKGGAPMSARTASVAEVRRKAQVGEGYHRGYVPPQAAKPGDLILFGNSHIGMVKRVEGGRIRYVGGNQSDGVNESTAPTRGASIVRPKYGARKR